MPSNGETRTNFKYIADPKSYYNESSNLCSIPCRTRWENIKLNKISILLRKKWVKRY